MTCAAKSTASHARPRSSDARMPSHQQRVPAARRGGKNGVDLGLGRYVTSDHQLAVIAAPGPDLNLSGGILRDEPSALRLGENGLQAAQYLLGHRPGQAPQQIVPEL